MHRKTPLKRKAPLQAKTPLRSRRVHPKPRRRPDPTRTDWEGKRAALYTRAGGRCEWGGCPLDDTGMEAHHRKLRSQGGGHSLVNLAALCPEHHAYAHAHPAEAVDRGFIVPRPSDPAARVVQLWDGRTVRLEVDGGYDVVWPDAQGGAA